MFLSSLEHQLKDRAPDAHGTNILSEVFPERVADMGAVGFVLSRLPHGAGPILWVQDRLSAKEAGRPSLMGLGRMRPLLMAEAGRAIDALWAMEEGLRCKALAAVIGEIWGDPLALSFTATKRLALRAEAGGVPCWLIRRAASPDLSAARDRWRVASIASAPNPDDAKAPGDPQWRVELFRSRRSQPGEWVARHDGQTNRVDFHAPFRDGALVEDDREIGRRGAG